MTNYPIWMTQEQADRLKVEVEAAGFTDVGLGELDAGQKLGVTARADGKALSAFATEPSDLANIVYNLKKQRDARKGEGSQLGTDES